MSTPTRPGVTRKPSGVRVMLNVEDQASPGKVNSSRATGNAGRSPVNAEREVEILNHCFDDIERFMLRLQQTAEAQSVLNQRNKKRSRKSKTNEAQEDDLLSMKAYPPAKEEFVDIFQKFKYSLCLLDRLKSTIAEPSSPELLHHVFVPLRLMAKTTGPDLAASVVSPAMTAGAVSLLQGHLTAEENELWTSLGQNWTSSRSHLGVSVPPYSPVFLDGWQPQTFDSSGQPVEDPIESQHKQDALRESIQAQNVQNQARDTEGSGSTEEVDGNGLPEGERLYCCSYDFVARNSSELSVLQGETLEVVESSKRWWKCRNRFNQIGFVPHNLLEPLSELNKPRNDSSVKLRESKTALPSRSKSYSSYAPMSSVGSSYFGDSQPVRPQSMMLPSTTLEGEDRNRGQIMNDELLEKLAGRRSSPHPLVVSRSTDITAPLNYHSPPAEVKAWLAAKGFKENTVQSLGILNGAQLFSLNKEELRTVSSEEGARVYGQIMIHKALLEDVHNASELEAAMKKQKLKIGLHTESELV